jgi:predicted lipoprotein with Yx(FWY)xxD motif
MSVELSDNTEEEVIMRNRRSVITAFGGAATVAALSLAGSGIGAGAATTYGSPMKSQSPTTPMAQPTRVQSAKVATLHTAATTFDGKTETILVNAQGLPLYYYQFDTGKKSLVTGNLARLWPPLVAASPTATGTHGKLTTLKDAAGRQVAYNGHFLYTFVDDAPGHVTGQGVQSFFVATPHLKAIGSASTVKTSAPATGNGYGY